jgi:hypothetical protein
MRIRRALAAWLVLAAANARGDAGSRYLYERVLIRQAIDSEEIVSVALDSDVYARTRDGFPNLRLLDQTDREVPYVLERAADSRPRQEREVCKSKVVSLSELGDGGLEIHVELDDAAPSAGGLTIHTPLRDFARRVRVVGSVDGAEWTPLGGEGLIFDYRRFVDLGNRDVALPANEFRHFKLIIDQVADARESPLRVLTQMRGAGGEHSEAETIVVETRPFRIDRIELWRLVEREGAREPLIASYPVASFGTAEDTERKRTRIVVHTRREPLSALILETLSQNFRRYAAVRLPAMSGIKMNWVDAGHGTIEQIQFRDFRRESLRVEFPEVRSDQYEIVIDNGDGPPLEIQGVHGEGSLHRLVFLAKRGQQYRLAYGSSTVEPPRYDASAVLAPLRAKYPTSEARLGEPIRIEGIASRSSLRDLLNHPVTLLAAIGLMVIVLALVLYRAGMRIKKLPEEAL